MSLFGGLWKHQNNPGCTKSKSVTSLMLKLDMEAEEHTHTAFWYIWILIPLSEIRKDRCHQFFYLKKKKKKGTEHANWPANLENVQCHLQVSFAYSKNTFVKRKFLFVCFHQIWTRITPICYLTLYHVGKEKGWLMRYLILLPHIPASDHWNPGKASARYLLTVSNVTV